MSCGIREMSSATRIFNTSSSLRRPTADGPCGLGHRRHFGKRFLHLARDPALSRCPDWSYAGPISSARDLIRTLTARAEQCFDARSIGPTGAAEETYEHQGVDRGVRGHDS